MKPKLDAVGLLRAEHRQIKRLFTNFKSHCVRGAPGKERRAIAAQICDAVTLHSQIEEGLFYPLVRSATSEDALMDEALVEHTVANDLIIQISVMHPMEMLYDAKIIVLGDIVNHHFEEEESDMFPAAFSAGIDLVELASRMSQRRKEIIEALVRSRSSLKVLAATRHRGADDLGATVEVPRVGGKHTALNAT